MRPHQLWKDYKFAVVAFVMMVIMLVGVAVTPKHWVREVNGVTPGGRNGSTAQQPPSGNSNPER